MPISFYIFLFNICKYLTVAFQYVSTAADILDLLSAGERSRSVAATQMNDTSSRSHSVFIIHLQQTAPDGSSKIGM